MIEGDSLLSDVLQIGQYVLNNRGTKSEERLQVIEYHEYPNKSRRFQQCFEKIIYYVECYTKIEITDYY